MKIGVIREGKNPPDERVVLLPEAVVELQNTYPELEIKVQPSAVRTVSDEEYAAKGIEVTEDLSDCDVLLGVKEVPKEDLIPNKKYFFFSHTIKEQPYNRGLLQTVLEKNIQLIDWECLVDPTGARIIGFGRFAGIVGAYNGFLAYGKREGTYTLKAAHECKDLNELHAELKKVVLPNLKIVLTGGGRVANGSIEMLDSAGIKKVSKEAFLNESFDEPVYVQLQPEDYYKRKDGLAFTREQLFNDDVALYASDFMKYAAVSDVFIAGHYYAEGAPYLFTREDAKSSDFKIRLVADISCDIDGPVASTIRPSTIANPLYYYNVDTEAESDTNGDRNVLVMAVDNLPCELPFDASYDFGKNFVQKIMPAFFNGDKDAILKNGSMTQNGSLTERYDYLTDYVNGK